MPYVGNRANPLRLLMRSICIGRLITTRRARFDTNHPVGYTGVVGGGTAQGGGIPMSFRWACEDCSGTGTSGTTTCQTCEGTGTMGEL